MSGMSVNPVVATAEHIITAASFEVAASGHRQKTGKHPVGCRCPWPNEPAG